MAPRRSVAKALVDEAFAASSEAKLRREEIDKIRDATKAESGWSQLKDGGKAVIPNGYPSTAYEKIAAASAALGLFLVEVGELEGWHRQYSRANKQAWLRQVFENRAYESSAAITMPEAVLTFVESRQ